MQAQSALANADHVPPPLALFQVANGCWISSFLALARDFRSLVSIAPHASSDRVGINGQIPLSIP
jgi:hypothetical protein